MKNNNESLQKQIIQQVGQNTINKYVLPEYIEDNISHELRDYQKEALAIFNAYMQNDFPFKEKPMQLLFNMATGSGKTLVMASLILELCYSNHDLIITLYGNPAHSIILYGNPEKIIRVSKLFL